ncbi:glycoside hydrolase superfamily [Mycena sp. CBHHK59/15]|nr:glycoside hydrolase superfamily [Mycena sp. CBHHK59/15]
MNAIVQLFEWPWDSVASECSSFIGPAGYGYVQVSPPSEHITGTQWWTDYQTVSYKLTSKRGSRAQFANMISTCASAGVGVIVDVVFNHMTSGSGIGFAGSSYSKYNYPAVPYTSSQFHYCNGNSASNINNYNNAYNVQFCELVGLADLAQEQTGVRQTIAAFLNDLLSLGVSGFRIDAAKHMVDADLAAILSLLTYPYYDTQEVIYGAGEAVQPSQYVTTGDVMEFRATSAVKSYFTGSPGIAALVTPTPMGQAWGFVASGVANYIMANQDTERGGNSLNSQSANNAYLLSAIFMLGFNYGTPTVYSGYDFSSYDMGAPQSSAGYTNPVTCGSNGWRCEHRWPAVANMNAFHNAVGSAALTNVQAGTSQQIAFGRGAIGFLIINNEGSAWSKTWSTSLPAGTYCDIIHDTTVDPTVCNGPSYTVSAAGTFSASVVAHDSLAIFTASVGSNTTTTNMTATSTTASPIPVSTTVAVTFFVTASTGSGDTIKVVGSISQLGTWAPASAPALIQPSSNAAWRLTVQLPPGTYFEYKYIRFSSGGSYTWESGSNRVYTTPGTAGLGVTLYGTFGSTTSSTSAVTASPVAPSTSAAPSSSIAVNSSSAALSSSSSNPVSASSSSPSTSSSSKPTSSSSAPASSSSAPASSSSAPASSSSAPSSSSSAPASSSSATASSSSAPASSSSAPSSSSISTVTSSTVSSSPAPASTGVTITFVETAATGTGEILKVVGSIAQLGSWTPATAIALTQPYVNADWKLTLSLPPGTYFEYKFIRVSSGGSVTWESGSNRVYTTPGEGSSVTLYGIFGFVFHPAIYSSVRLSFCRSSTTSSTSAVTSSQGSPGNTVGSATTTATPPSSTGATVTFSESATTSSGEVVKLVGSISQLGNWAPASAVALSNANSVWSVTLVLPPNIAFQYKFIRVKSGSVVWESDPNRSYTTLDQGSTVTLTSSFR